MKPVIIIAIAFIMLLPLFTIPTYAQTDDEDTLFVHLTKQFFVGL